MIDASKQPDDAPVAYAVDADRMRAFVLKLARGHAAFEISAKYRGPPTHLGYELLSQMSPDAAEAFDQPPPVRVWPEVGCRLMQRDCLVTLKAASREGHDISLIMFDWIEVQPARYRYLVSPVGCDGVLTRFVLSEFLACEVIWSEGENP